MPHMGDEEPVEEADGDSGLHGHLHGCGVDGQDVPQGPQLHPRE